MDRNTILGLVLIFVIMIGFGIMTQPSKEEREAMQRKADSLATVQAETQRQRAEAEQKQQAVMADSVQKKQVVAQMGSFASALEGEKRFVTLENNLMKVKVSTLGGRIYSVELKNYKKYNGEPLILFEGDENSFGLQFWGNNNNIQTNNLYFSPLVSDSILTAGNADSTSLIMRLQTADSSYIDYVYSIKHDSYLLGFDIKFNGMKNTIGGTMGSIDLLWNVNVPQLEKGYDNEKTYTTIAYHFMNEDYEEISGRGQEAKEEITTKLKWIDFKQQFFSSIIVAKEHFANADLTSTELKDGKHIRSFSSRISIPFKNDDNETIGFNFYFGPNHYKTLKKYEMNFEKVIPLGMNIIRWINKYFVINVFDFLSKYIGSYGLIILLLTILIKIILFPLTYKSYLSSAKMRVLKPQIDEINQKYPKKEDALKKQQAIMGLYKKVGVNPMGGCIPILIQFPILIAMFRFFPASFELRQESFLWADDLSAYDSILRLPFEIPWYGDHVSLFTLLMAAALFLTSKMNADQMGDTNAQMPGMKFMMTYMMPLMMLFWFNGYSSGLSYYYFLSNVFTIGQTYMIRQFVDDQAILAKLHENAKKPVKKSKWQDKLEQMAKRQQEVQKKKK
ncbi:MAG TPA: membrane protein insertase YidC [Tenuifilaceae bacterium]|nr:membrane protein insertase YidC [Tenuifilaceae bacterium]